jgi:hypothetical protein
VQQRPHHGVGRCDLWRSRHIKRSVTEEDRTTRVFELVGSLPEGHGSRLVNSVARGSSNHRALLLPCAFAVQRHRRGASHGRKLGRDMDVMRNTGGEGE